MQEVWWLLFIFALKIIIVENNCIFNNLFFFTYVVVCLKYKGKRQVGRVPILQLIMTDK